MPFLFVLFWCKYLLLHADTQTLPESIDFDEHIRPLLTQHCTACHGGVKQAAGLSFVYADQLSDVVEPGAAEQSYLVERITAEDEESRMPPPDHGPRLKPQDVALIRQWISEGAQWGSHWAYQLPVRSEAPPAVSNKQWCRQPVDYFVLSKLDELEIAPARDESPERWLRRVSFDLTGLPPSLAECEQFLERLDTAGEPAFAEVVERLLESPQFGERWATVWLDQVRYADSRGSSEDSPRDIWKYRDWVIDAFNDDLPYDEFTRKQIAGDLLPHPSIEDRLATAVHRLTHSNEEGGTDDEEFRTAAVLDRVTTTWQTWMGTTIGCVQCHDHPYDPLKHEEFYQSVAYFNNTADCDLTDDWPHLQVPMDPSDYEKASDLDRKIERLTKKLWERQWQASHQESLWKKLTINNVRSSNATRVVIKPRAVYDVYQTEGTVSRNPRITAQLRIPDDYGEITGIRLTAAPLKPELAKGSAEVGFVMSDVQISIQSPDERKAVPIKIAHVIGDEPFPHDAATQSLAKGNAGFGAYTRQHHERHLVLLPEQPIRVKPGSTLEVSVRYGTFDLAAFVLVANRGYYSISSAKSLTELPEDTSHHDLQAQLDALRKQRSEIKSIAIPILRERPAHLARDSHVFIRGLFLTKGEQVFPGVPQQLDYSSQPVPDRRAFAEWVVSDQNPLTARVAVNRFWARMFGTGLVATEEDFGSAGERPSHPALLDDLAVRFRDEYGWSVKRLLREIALSRSYRQSSQIRPDIQKLDAANRWLARGPRHNLPAEAVRDQMLSLSGLLSLKMHGEPTFPPLPAGVWRARRGSWKTAPKDDENRYRRSVYTYVKRSIPYPIFTTFDAPARDQCSPRRQRSNTPLQSLMLLNDTTFVECADALAKSFMAYRGELEQQLGYAFARVTLRNPRPEEVDQLRLLYHNVEQQQGSEQAMKAVAGVLLNLDEILVK